MGKRDPDDVLREHGVDALRAQLDEIPPEPPPVNTNRSERPHANGPGGSVAPFPFVLARDISIKENIKRCLIDGFLGRDEQSAWYGAPECGKSTVLIDAACHVASDLLWCGRSVMRGPVLYVAAERGRNVRRRVLAWRLEHGIDDFPLAVIDNAVDLRTGKIDADRIIASAASLSDAFDQPTVWIIFDTYNRVLAGGDENSPKDAGAVIGTIDRIYRATGAHCSLIHHVPADRTDRMRGHTLVEGAMDTTVRVTKQNGIVTVEIDKGSDLPEEEKPHLLFRFRPVILAEGPAITAPVLVEAEAAAAEGNGKTKAKTSRMPESARIALRALKRALDECGERVPASNHIPSNARVTTEARWRDYAYRSGISDGEDSARRKAFGRAFKHLVGTSTVCVWDDHIWIPTG